MDIKKFILESDIGSIVILLLTIYIICIICAAIYILLSDPQSLKIPRNNNQIANNQITDNQITDNQITD